MQQVKKHRDESELVDLLKSKDKAGMEHLYENYTDALYGVILKIVRKADVAEDILQETFVKIWNKIESYSSEKGRLYTWMLNIARNASIDYTRSKEYKKSTKVQSMDFAVHNQTDKRNTIQEDEIGMRELVKNLDPKCKALIDRVYFEGFTQQEVADELGIPLGTVKTRIRKAIMDLRSVFDVK